MPSSLISLLVLLTPIWCSPLYDLLPIQDLATRKAIKTAAELTLANLASLADLLASIYRYQNTGNIQTFLYEKWTSMEEGSRIHLVLDGRPQEQN